MAGIDQWNYTLAAGINLLRPCYSLSVFRELPLHTEYVGDYGGTSIYDVWLNCIKLSRVRKGLFEVMQTSLT